MDFNRRIFTRYVRFFNKHQAARYTLHFVYKVMPLLMFFAYPALLVYAFFYMRDDVLKLTLVPLGVFVAVTILRVVVNEKRPYERYGIPSVFRKTTKGKSFPSRHTASAFIIAMAFLYADVPLGIAALTVALFGGPSFLNGVSNVGVKIAYMYVSYILWELCFTFADVPFNGMTTAVSLLPRDRTRVISFSTFISGFR